MAVAAVAAVEAEPAAEEWAARYSDWAYSSVDAVVAVAAAVAEETGTWETWARSELAAEPRLAAAAAADWVEVRRAASG